MAYQRDPRYLQYYAWIDRTPEDAQRFGQLLIDQQRERPCHKLQLAIVLKDAPHLIGSCGIRLAARAIVHFSFAELKLHRLTAWCIADNAVSAHVLEKLGLRLEGGLREKEYFKDRWWDTLLYAILKDEWHG